MNAINRAVSDLEPIALISRGVYGYLTSWQKEMPATFTVDVYAADPNNPASTVDWTSPVATMSGDGSMRSTVWHKVMPEKFSSLKLYEHPANPSEGQTP